MSLFGLLSLLLLLVLQELNNKVLVILDEIIRKTLRGQVVSEMLPPKRVESLQCCELRRCPMSVAIDAARGWTTKVRACGWSAGSR